MKVAEGSLEYEDKVGSTYYFRYIQIFLSNEALQLSCLNLLHGEFSVKAVFDSLHHHDCLHGIQEAVLRKSLSIKVQVKYQVQKNRG